MSAVEAKGLGRRVPTDWKHVDKFPLSALPEKARTVSPVVLGVNWYTDFDSPVQKGRDWWIGLNPQGLGSIRGGHCVCLEDGLHKDSRAYYTFYDQGNEGACVGFGSSRAMSLFNRHRYYARWLWDHAKMRDDWPDTNPGDDNGTSVRAAMEVLRVAGHVLWKSSYRNDSVQARDDRPAQIVEGIWAYRWASSIDDVLTTLANPKATKLGAVPVLNSWGTSYPHRVWMPGETLERLRNEEGEIAVITDR